MIRNFDWRDFPNLHRRRGDGLWLDTELALTRWMSLVPVGALLSNFAPATGIFTYVATTEIADSIPVIGQFTHAVGAPNAKLTFLTPEDEIESANVPALFEYLATKAGEHGAHNLLAEVNERSAAYDVLRKTGFATYTRQQIWELTEGSSEGQSLWRTTTEKDEHHVQHLYNALVPPLVQQAEPPPWEKMKGLLFEKAGDPLAYAHLSYGPKGILAQPFVHPDTENVEALLKLLYTAIPEIRSRPVYLCVRSHQAWLASFLEDLGYQVSERQAVMVKRLATRVKSLSPAHQPTGLKTAHPGTSTYSPSLKTNEPEGAK